jgi:hypothetical protein
VGRIHIIGHFKGYFERGEKYISKHTWRNIANLGLLAVYKIFSEYAENIKKYSENKQRRKETLGAFS